MDALRVHHLTDGQFGQVAGRFSHVRWYPCAPGAKAFPGEHAFLNPVWDSRCEDWGVSPGVRTIEEFRPKRFPAPDGQHFHGRAEWFLHGIPESYFADLPAYPAERCGKWERVGGGGSVSGGTAVVSRPCCICVVRIAEVPHEDWTALGYAQAFDSDTGQFVDDYPVLVDDPTEKITHRVGEYYTCVLNEQVDPDTEFALVNPLFAAHMPPKPGAPNQLVLTTTDGVTTKWRGGVVAVTGSSGVSLTQCRSIFTINADEGDVELELPPSEDAKDGYQIVIVREDDSDNLITAIPAPGSSDSINGTSEYVLYFQHDVAVIRCVGLHKWVVQGPNYMRVEELDGSPDVPYTRRMIFDQSTGFDLRENLPGVVQVSMVPAGPNQTGVVLGDDNEPSADQEFSGAKLFHGLAAWSGLGMIDPIFTTRVAGIAINVPGPDGGSTWYVTERVGSSGEVTMGISLDPINNKITFHCNGPGVVFAPQMKLTMTQAGGGEVVGFEGTKNGLNYVNGWLIDGTLTLATGDIPDLSAIYEVTGTSAATLAAANAYTDTVGATVLAAANSYTDAEIAALTTSFQPVNTGLSQLAALATDGFVMRAGGVYSVQALPATVAQGGTGATTHGAKQLLIGNGTGAVLTSAGLFWEDALKAIISTDGTCAVRVLGDPTFGRVEATDPTGANYYTPLLLGGSTLSIHTAGTFRLFLYAGGAFQTEGLASGGTNFTGVTGTRVGLRHDGTSGTVFAHDFTAGVNTQLNVLGSIVTIQSDSGGGATLWFQADDNGISWFGASTTGKQTVSGVRTGTLAQLQAAFASLLNAFSSVGYNLIDDITT